MSPNLRIKLDKRLKSDLRGEKRGFLVGKKKKRNHRENEGRERSSNFSPRSTEIDCSVFVGPRTKVNLHDESYAWVPETKDFTKDSSEELGRSWVSGLRDFRNFVFTPRSRDSS